MVGPEPERKDFKTDLGYMLALDAWIFDIENDGDRQLQALFEQQTRET